MLCTIWYNLYNLNVKNNHKAVILLVKLQAEACNFTNCDCMLLHVTYAFQSESTLYICLNVKELLARNIRVPLQSFTNCITPPWVFFTFLKL